MELISSNIKFSSIEFFKQLPGNFLILSPNIPDFTIIEVTDQYCDATFTKRDQLIGLNMFDAFPDNPDDPLADGVTNLKASLIKCIQDKRTDYMPVQKYDIADQQTGGFISKYWLPVNKPVLENGMVQYVIHSVEDVSENRLLKMSENNFRALADETPFMIWRCVDGNCKYVNKAWIDFTGISFNDSLGKGFIKAFHPDDLPEQSSLFFNAMKNQSVYESKYRLRRKDAEYRWIYNKASPHTFDGMPIEYIGSLIDITDQEIKIKSIVESEKQFRQMADSIVQMIWITDANGMHEYYNQRWYDFTGATHAQTEGEGWNEMFHPDDRARAWEKWKHSLETGEIYEIEYRLKNVQGDYVWVLGRAAPFYDENGKILKWFGTCTDIDAQKLLQQKKEEFISVASHELKTPLTSLSVSIEILEKELSKSADSNPIMQKMVHMANGQVKKLSKLVGDLLNATNLENGRFLLSKKSFSIKQMLTNCLKVIDQQGHHINIQIEEDYSLFADESKIEQVVINLLNNAIKYANESKEIIVKTEKENDDIKVSIQDFGKGIFPEKIPFIFDRYYRVGNKGNQYSGLGLGLYISKQIIVSHNGTINVNSKEGEGSTFWFTLPCNKMP